MALSQSALSELLDAFRTGDGVDMIRESVRTVLQELVEFEAASVIGADRYERSDDRVTERNGTRAKLLTTKAGDIELRIPKLRKGSFFPSILEPRRRIDQALYAVVMEAYVHGVSTRSVDDLVVALGADSGISKSEVSRICAQLDEVVGAFRTRALDHIGFLTSISTRPTCTCVTSRAKAARSCRWRSWSPPGSPPTAPGRCWASTSATARTRRSGVGSCSACDSAVWRGAAGHLRPTFRAGEGAEAVLPRLLASTVPSPLRPQPARPCPQDPRRHGRCGVPHDLRPTRPRGCQPGMGGGP